MYRPHPSQELTELFRAKPYQGAPPEDARYLFVGLDANYAPDIESSAVFGKVREYHEDGVGFWRRHGVHHPFLLPGYAGDGRFYHRSFARIGFTPEHAPEVSFIELLAVPTAGRNALRAEDLDPAHLERINRCILGGGARHVFLSAGVARLMRATRRFPWLRSRPTGERHGLETFYQDLGRAVYLHLHFSNYGRFEARKREEAAAIRALLLAEA